MSKLFFKHHNQYVPWHLVSYLKSRIAKIPTFGWKLYDFMYMNDVIYNTTESL